MWRLHEKDKRKYDLARRYGLTQRLLEVGWAGLSAKESGRIGGGLHGKKITSDSGEYECTQALRKYTTN